MIRIQEVNNMDYQQNPRISLSGTVDQLELKAGYWVQCQLKAEYDSQQREHKKTACVEIAVDPKDEQFVIRTNKNVKIEYWEDLQDSKRTGKSE